VAEQRGSPPLSTRSFPGLAGWGRQGPALKGEVEWQVQGALEPVQGPRERGLGARVRQRRRAALRPHDCLLPVPLAQAGGGQPPQTGQLLRVPGCKRRRTEQRGCSHALRVWARGRSRVLETDGGQQPACLGASLRACCCPRSGKHLGSYFQTPFQGPFKQEKPRDNRGCVSLKTVFH